MHFNRIFLFLFCCFLPFCGACRSQATAINTEKQTKNEAEIDFLDTLTFLGDSTTAHMELRAPAVKGRVLMTKNRFLNLSPRVTYEQVICPQNGKEMTIAEAVSIMRPQRLVITLGIDYGVYYYQNDQKSFALCYEKLLDAIHAASPSTTVVLQSIFPVSKQCRNITNAMIDTANQTIAGIAARRGIVFVDASRVLRDADGYLKENFCYSNDGIHLTEAAYTAILKNLESYAQEIEGAV